MTLGQIQQDIQQLTPADFQDLRLWIVSEAQRREAQPLVEKAQAEIITDLRDKGVIPTPEVAKEPPKKPEEVKKIPAWSNPGTDHARMYVLGDIVTHNGKVWQSEVDGLNSWEPGAEGVWHNIWRDITPAPPVAQPDGTAKTPDGTQAAPFPFKAGLQVTAGQYVTYQGAVYKVLQGHTTADHWAPPNVASLFTKAS